MENVRNIKTTFNKVNGFGETDRKLFNHKCVLVTVRANLEHIYLHADEAFKTIEESNNIRFGT